VALSRRCDGWWAPDDLLDVERGVRTQDDAAIVSLCRMYDLPARPLAEPDGLELIIDRSEAVDVATGMIGDEAFEDTTQLAAAALLRLAAVARLLDAPELLRGSSVEVAAAACSTDTREIRSTLAWIDGAAADRVADTVGHLAERVAVPSVGLLISPTPNGSLLVTRRAGGALRPRRGGLPAAGQLRWYLEPVISAA